MGIWEGYALLYLYPENPGWNDHYHYCAGFLFGFFLIMFWKRFLSLSIQLPWYNRIMKVLAWITFSFAIYALTPFSDFYTLILLAYVTTLAIIIITLAANSRIVLMRQRYALYALLSSFSIIASFTIYIFAAIPFIPGDDYTGNPIYLGFAIELVVLILSLLSRVRFNKELRSGRAITTGLNKKTYSRIKHFDLRNLVSTLDKLMKVDKLYRDDDISLKSLADQLSISRHQLSELIKNVYNTNFYGYINDWRIREAKILLVHEKERTILSIALDVGYNSKSTFNHSFKKTTGITPTEFRNLNTES
jgi:AraC-like DNA-binding protein